MLDQVTRSIIDDAAREEEGEVDNGRDRPLLCAACGSVITRTTSRIAVDGTHEHVRTNPHGLVFRFGCYRDAPGCARAGQPTAEHTWFPGCRWTVALCGSCGVHLGWRFDGSEPTRFYGLIVGRLVAG